MSKPLFKFPLIEAIITVISFVFLARSPGTTAFVFAAFAPAMFYHFVLMLFKVQHLAVWIALAGVVTVVGIIDFIVGPMGFLDVYILPAGIGLFIACALYAVWLKIGRDAGGKPAHQRRIVAASTRNCAVMAVRVPPLSAHLRNSRK